MSKNSIFLCTLVSLFVFNSANTALCLADSEDKNDWRTAARQLGYKPGELIVRFKPNPDGKRKTKAEKLSVLDSINGGTIKHSFKLVPGLSLIKLPENATVAGSLGPFRANSNILYAYPNHFGKGILATPDDTYFNDLWGMHNTGQSEGTEDADIDAPEAWDVFTDAGDMVVAVIDTGVDYNHTDLSENMWVNEAELNGIPDFDDDGNGYTDDIYGYDFCNEDGEPWDDAGHGTHCAGTIGIKA